MPKTKADDLMWIRNQATDTDQREAFKRDGQALTKDELLAVAEVFDADVSPEDTNAEIRAGIMNAAGRTRGSTAEDFPGPFRAYEVSMLRHEIKEASG